jgi:hypothetical protein
MRRKPEKAYRPSLFAVAGIWARLAYVDMKLRLSSPRSNKEWLHGETCETLPPLDPEQRAHALGLEKLVATASVHPLIFNMSCLRRALVMRSLLAKRDIPSRLVFGVKKSYPGSPPQAHAWLDLGDFRLGFGVVSEKPDFVPFTR